MNDVSPFSQVNKHADSTSHHSWFSCCIPYAIVIFTMEIVALLVERSVGLKKSFKQEVKS